MRHIAATPWVRRTGWIVLALVGFGLSAGAYADDRHRTRDHERSSHYAQKRHQSRHTEPRHRSPDYDRHHHRRPAIGHAHAPKPLHRKGWHYHAGRYWAPPSYRGRYCTDRRHFHGVHYHVAVRDYYDYYYPRYRYYGPPPASGVASLIISVPLF